VKWFKHDSDASIDAKLQEVLLDYGATGYGLYWYCIEMIAKDVSPKNITFELEHDSRIIARNLNLSIKEVQDMMQKMVDLGLFDISQNKKITCLKMAYRLDDSTKKGIQTSEIISNLRKNSEKFGKIPNDSEKVRPEEDIDIDKEEDRDKEIEKEEEKEIGRPAVAEQTKKTITQKNLEKEGVDAQIAKDWLFLRKAKRLPLTPSAWEITKDEGAKVGLSPGETVRHSVSNNWAGFKASWYAKTINESSKNGTLSKNSQQSFAEREEKAARERIEQACPNIAAKDPRMRDVIDITPLGETEFLGVPL
jgi:glucan-binding YG repeat protein